MLLERESLCFCKTSDNQEFRIMPHSDSSDGPEEATFHVQRLNLDEIEHELFVRDVHTEEQESKSAKLAEVLQQPVKTGKVKELDQAEEVVILTTKITEIQTLLVEMLANKTPVDADSRVVALYLHCFYRMRRNMFLDPAHFSDYQQLAKRLNLSQFKLDVLTDDLLFPKLYDSEDEQADMDELEEIKRRRDERRKSLKKEERESKQREEERRQKGIEEILRRNEKKSTSRSKKNNSNKKSKKSERDKYSYREPHQEFQTDESDVSDQLSDQSDRSDDRSSRASSSRILRRRNPLLNLKRKTTYSGTEDLPAFLLDVEECAEINKMTEEEILLGITNLLEGKAETWYRRKRAKIASWKALKREMTSAFNAEEDDETVLDKINGLKQDKKETFAVFEAQMEELFDRLSAPLTEREKIKKLMKGLHLYYRSRILSGEVDSVRTLRSKCRALEKDKSQVLKMEQEQRKKDLKKDEREEKKNKKYTKVAKVDVSRGASAGSGSDSEVCDVATPMRSTPLLCWRCGESGHFSIKCTTPIHCIQCGAPDTIAERCPKCSHDAARGKSSKKAAISKEPENSPGESRGGKPFLGPFNHPPPALGTKGPKLPKQQT